MAWVFYKFLFQSAAGIIDILLKKYVKFTKDHFYWDKLYNFSEKILIMGFYIDLIDLIQEIKIAVKFPKQCCMCRCTV